MKISEARRFVKTMVDQQKALAIIGDALALLEDGDAQIEGLIKRKQTLEDEVNVAQDRLRATQAEVTEKIDELNRKHKEQMALFDAEINDKATKLAGLNKELADVRTAMHIETQRLISERSAELKKIDMLVADRANRLDKMNQEIEKVRTKIME